MEAASTETTRFCPMCATPMRPRAVFCHRCGKPYPEETAVVYKTKSSQASVPTTEEFEAQWNTLTDKRADLQVAEAENIEPQNSLPESEIKSGDKTVSKTEKGEKKPRVRRRVVQTTEYVWEEPTTDPTWRFVLATVIILVFVFLILFLGGFIRF